MRAFVHPSVQSANRVGYDKRKPFLTKFERCLIKSQVYPVGLKHESWGGVLLLRPTTFMQVAENISLIRIESSHTNQKKGKWVPGLKGVLCQRRGSPFEMMERREVIVRKDSLIDARLS